MANVVEQAEHITNDDINTAANDARNSGKVDTKPAEVYIQTAAIQAVEEVAQAPTRWLTVSPYLEQEHLLDLDSVDTPNRLLALALTELEAATPQYATVRYEE